MHEYLTGMLERLTFSEHNISISAKENMHEGKKDKTSKLLKTEWKTQKKKKIKNYIKL